MITSMVFNGWSLGGCLVLATTMVMAEVRVQVDRLGSGEGGPAFQFPNVPRPRTADAAAGTAVVVVEGRVDLNGAGPEALVDGKLPAHEDDPSAQFFFGPNTDGGRLLVDVGRVVTVGEVNTYSWHPASRGPQVYTLYASTGEAEGFVARPRRGDPGSMAGWEKVAEVNTRPASGEVGGQYGVRIDGKDGELGRWRYFLFDVSRTDPQDIFSNTFFSEIDVVELGSPVEPAPAAPPVLRETFATEDGLYQFTVISTDAPDLGEWAREHLHPVVKAWYPKIVGLLPSEGYEAPKEVTILFRDGMGGTPASASGARVNCNREWFRRELQREARGSVVHELVHVVQQYGRGPRGARRPGWLVEGIADYIRWFLYEPETRGAEISLRNLDRARYDASYRVTANFLNWATLKYDDDLVPQLNVALRQGTYSEDLWKERTGRTVEALGAEWREALERDLRPPTGSEK
jgi:hypothetical protein